MSAWFLGWTGMFFISGSEGAGVFAKLSMFIVAAFCLLFLSVLLARAHLWANVSSLAHAHLIVFFLAPGIHPAFTSSSHLSLLSLVLFSKGHCKAE